MDVLFSCNPSLSICRPYGRRSFHYFFKENVMNILIRNPRNLAAAAAMLFGVCAATGVYAEEPANKSKANEKSKSASKSKPEKKDDVIVEVPVLMMVPVEVSKDMVTNKGCWVKLYDKKNYQGDSLVITGPIDLPQMIGPFGFNWENKVRSLEIGPNSNLTIYDNRDFRDEDKFIDANAKVPDMSKKMGFFDDFRSMQLSCI